MSENSSKRPDFYEIPKIDLSTGQNLEIWIPLADSPDVCRIAIREKYVLKAILKFRLEDLAKLREGISIAESLITYSEE